ncbi:MAG: acyl-ACP--UDP-N-acetylglucosamine O-acyltransferase [Candidatus Omnitrophica bacterium]|nr:acyl-ACP--UDP-N-acetylglucosamine O-acyltransferase [Candidatus Omnitrophota bacterium]
MSEKNTIHPTAIIHSGARIGNNVAIGANTLIGEHVRIGAGTLIGNNCVLDGRTTLGRRGRVFTGAVIGSVPQDLKYQGEPSEVIIGDDNVIREYVTINLGTGENGKTVIGNRNLFMANTHVAHDCRIQDDAIVANVSAFAGHVSVEARVVVGGLSGIHQFVRLGKIAIIAGCSRVIQDVPPFAMVAGQPARVYGINSIGLKRAAIDAQSIRYIKTAFRILFYERLGMSHAVQKVSESVPVDDPQIAYLLDFIKNSKRGICRGSYRVEKDE